MSTYRVVEDEIRDEMGYERILQDFPNLTRSNSSKTSGIDWDYNCIAWAAERGPDEGECWWPIPDEEGFRNSGYTWPSGVDREENVESFIAAFQTLGYEVCENGEREPGWQKVVIYANANGPTHMARQLEDGRWTSKMGANVDLTHTTVEALEGPDYGVAVQYLRRRNSQF